jgi:methylenetetrahydrofolate dehydrogenase (NADP+)/methenyltetrahydrofolate cyclohydrolase
MTAALIDGKAIAADLRARVMAAVHDLRDSHGIVLGLAVVLVGDDPASEVYIGVKKMCAEPVPRPDMRRADQGNRRWCSAASP